MNIFYEEEMKKCEWVDRMGDEAEVIMLSEHILNGSMIVLFKYKDGGLRDSRKRWWVDLDPFLARFSKKR